MTQHELGQAIGCTRANISLIETGGGGLTIERAYQIAEALQVPLSELLVEPQSAADPADPPFGGLTVAERWHALWRRLDDLEYGDERLRAELDHRRALCREAGDGLHALLAAARVCERSSDVYLNALTVENAEELIARLREARGG